MSTPKIINEDNAVSMENFHRLQVHAEELKRQRDTLLAAAKAALPYVSLAKGYAQNVGEHKRVRDIEDSVREAIAQAQVQP